MTLFVNGVTQTPTPKKIIKEPALGDSDSRNQPNPMCWAGCLLAACVVVDIVKIDNSPELFCDALDVHDVASKLPINGATDEP